MAASRRQLTWLAAALALALTGYAAHWQLGLRAGLARTVFRDAGFTEPPLRSGLTTAVDLQFLDEDRHLPRRFFSARWQGVWVVPETGTYRIQVSADDRAAVIIDGRRAVEGGATTGPGVAEVSLDAGPHSLVVEYAQLAGAAFLNVRVSRPGGEPEPLPSDQLFPHAPTRSTRAVVAVLRAVRWLAWAGAGFAALPLLFVVVRHARRVVAEPRLRVPLAVAAVLLLAAALRLDALLAKYGPLERPRWAAELQIHGADRLAALRPEGFGWVREATPYVGGDPVGYLRFAREMRDFYAAHVREPLFVYATKVWLGALGDEDVGISFTSLTFSLLLVAATYLLGAAAFSPAVGLAASFLIAIEREAIAWGVDGWRDDTFAAFVVLFAWALVRYQKAPTMMSAVLAGVMGGAACLTRLSSLTFVVPGLAAMIVVPGLKTRTAAARAAAACLITTVLVAPYLINCWRQFGDPFYAVNYHTSIYQGREGRARRDTSATGYVGSKIVGQPLRSMRVGATGLTTFPFLNKWRGFDAWVPGAGWVLAVAAVVGLLSWLRSSVGRLLILLLMTSLIPYALTWPIAGGAEWRFTMHAYPFYLIAAMCVVVLPAFRLTSWRRPWPTLFRRRPYLIGITIVFLGLAAVAARWWPWLEFREALSAGEAAIVEFGARDAAFVDAGWSAPARSGDRHVRFATAIRASVHVPLPQRRPYRVRLRLDPFEADRPQRISVFVNSAPIGTVLAGETPEVDGAYELPMPAAAVREGTNRIELLATYFVPARVLRSRAAGLGDDDAAAFRMWDLTVQ